MAIELRTFASGDTDYISKMNSNVSDIEAAINALQQQAAGAGGATPMTTGMFWDALFNGADCLIGPGSYAVTQQSGGVSVSAGSMYLASSQTIVQWYLPVTITFTGQTAGTKYITVDSTGQAAMTTTLQAGSAYSVVWTGSGFAGQPIRVAAVFFDAAEATASRESDVLGSLESPPEVPQIYATLDDRLEAVEEVAVQAKTDAADALALAYESAGGAGSGTRKIGCTVTGLGVVGAIQVDFTGMIVGWSVIADAVGTLTVEVDRKASSPPPAAPAIPNTTTDKISASAPVQLSAAQSAARAESGVSTWTRVVNPWDVLQFNVTAFSGLTRATLYLRLVMETEISAP